MSAPPPSKKAKTEPWPPPSTPSGFAPPIPGPPPTTHGGFMAPIPGPPPTTVGGFAPPIPGPPPTAHGGFMPPVPGHPPTGVTGLAPPVTHGGALPPVATPPRVKFRIDQNGKIRYHEREDGGTRTAHAADYMEMSQEDFLTFKGAGKRYGSNKITDPQTMRSYVHDAATGQFHVFDKTQADNKGAAVTALEQTSLTAKHGSGQLMDRSRASRIGAALEPFDVGHYQQAPTGSKMDVLSGKTETFGANRDHVPSGESLRQRAHDAGSGNKAYKEGLTIAIPNEEMHRPHSATYGGRQTSKDTVGSVTKKRVQQDADHPTHGFYRDVSTMLDRTAGQNHGAVDPKLDLSSMDNRVLQTGAYRKLYKANVKMHGTDPSRGVDPSEAARTVTHTPKPSGKIGTFTSPPDASGTQGNKVAQKFSQTLRATGKAV